MSAFRRKHLRPSSESLNRERTSQTYRSPRRTVEVRKIPKTRVVCEETWADNRFAERKERRKVNDSTESLTLDFDDSGSRKVHFQTDSDISCPPVKCQANSPPAVYEIPPRSGKRPRGKPQRPPTHDAGQSRRRARRHYGTYGAPSVKRKRGTPAYMERHRHGSTPTRKNRKEYGDPKRKGRKRNRSSRSREREVKGKTTKSQRKSSPSKRKRGRQRSKESVVSAPSPYGSQTSREHYGKPIREHPPREREKGRKVTRRTRESPIYDDEPHYIHKHASHQKEICTREPSTADEAELARRQKHCVKTCSADIMKADWKGDHQPVTTRVSFRDPETKLETIVIISNEDDKTRSIEKTADKCSKEACTCSMIGQKDIVLKLDNLHNKNPQSNRVEIVPGVFTVQVPNFNGNCVPWNNDTKEGFKMYNNDGNFYPFTQVIGQQRDPNFQLSPQFDKFDDKTRKYIPPYPFSFFDETEKYLTKINDLSKKEMENSFRNTLNNNAVINERKRNKPFELEKLYELHPEKILHKSKQNNKNIFLNKLESTLTLKSNETEKKLKIIRDPKRYLGRGYIKYLAKQFDKRYQEELKRESLMNKTSKNSAFIKTLNSRKKMYTSDSDMNESSSTHDMSERRRCKNYGSNFYYEVDDNEKVDSLMEPSYPKTSIYQLERSPDKNEIMSELSLDRTDDSIREPLTSGMLCYYSKESSISELAKKSQKSYSKSFWKKVVNNLITNKNLFPKTASANVG